MDKRLMALMLVLVSALASACGGLMARDDEPEKLFFAMRIEEGGQVIAHPHLLGETGHKLSMRLVDPARPELTRLALEMDPQREGKGYRVKVGLGLPQLEAPRVGELSIAHGEERRLALGTDGKLTVTLMLMRVDSPEFKAWLKLVEREQQAQSS
jgi:hypothetical protein